MRLSLPALAGLGLSVRVGDFWNILFDNASFQPIAWSSDKAAFLAEHGGKRAYMVGVPCWKFLEILSERAE